MKASFRTCAIAALLFGFGSPSMSAAEELRVAVASNFAALLGKLAPVFEQQSGHELIIIAGATGQHYTQIINGAPYDVFLAADDERPGMLVKEDRAIAGSVFTYAIGQLVLWSTDASLIDSDARVLQSNDFRYIAIANPRLAPYGAAAEQVLRTLGLWEGMQGKIVMGENITQTLQFVATGNAQLGFIARSQWLENDRTAVGSVWQVPATLHSPIVQQGVLLRDSSASQDFKAFLLSEQARAVIEAAGYGTAD